MSKVFLLTLAAGLGLAAAQPVAAATTIDGQTVVGNDAVGAPGATEVDTCTFCGFVLNDAFGTAGLNVISFEFNAFRAGTLTPFLSTRLDNGTDATFTITAVGQAVSAIAGFNQFAFTPVSGSSITSANTYFGFAYGGADGNVVSFDYFPPNTAGTFIAGGAFTPTQPGAFTSSFASIQHDALSALNDRTYSINATAIPAVPEPATWALMILGFGIVGSALRRRTQVRFDFA